jgi:hypothetical protein
MDIKKILNESNLIRDELLEKIFKSSITCWTKIESMKKC